MLSQAKMAAGHFQSVLENRELNLVAPAFIITRFIKSIIKSK
jgi:hypothetical protein